MPVTTSPENPELKQARLEAESALPQVASDPNEAMGESAEAARLSLDALEHLTGDDAREAVRIYDFSVARLMEAIQESSPNSLPATIKLPGPNGPLWLKLRSDSLETWNPHEDRFQVADRLRIGGTYFPDPASIPGVGAPLIVTGPPRNDPWSPSQHFFPATALVSFSGHHGTINVVNPYGTTTVPLAGKSRTVAADFSAPLAVFIVTKHPQRIGLRALLNAGKFAKGARLVMMGPYRPGVQPVIFIHGLMSTPVAWVPQMNALNNNSELRKKYQIWYFQYPTSPPFPISAEVLREDLAAIYQKYPDTPKAILVGHSMGGLISQLLLCDSGTQFSRDILGKTVAELNLASSDRLLAGALEFKASPYVSAVIFEATPHRGAQMAANPLGRIGAMLITLPYTMVSAGADLIARARATHGDQVIRRFPNSIDTLRPQALIILALDKLPLNPQVPYYSIIGDVDPGGDVRQSTDGIVPYASSHLAGARSEKIVPYGHSYVPLGPETIAEVERILLTN